MSQTKIVLNRQSDLILDNAQITAPVGIVLADVAGAPEAIASEESLRVAAVAAEESARIAGDAAEESARVAAVTAEESARIAGDANLQNQIDNVLSNVDGAALDSLTEIVTAFQSADGDLNGAIIALSEAATSSLSAEVEARISDVDAEQARAESATISLFERTKYEIGMAIDGEQARAESAEDVLTADLSAEVEARISDVDAEESRAIEAEGELGDYVDQSISTEESARIDADASLAAEISTEASIRFYHIVMEVSKEASMRVVDVDAEESRAIAAEGVLTSDLSSEVAARETAIDNESSARIDGDQSLQNQIDFITDNTDAAAIDSLTEIVAAFQSADGEINGAITTLADAAGANLSTEVARATSVEAVLTADLSTEVAARIADVQQLTTNLSKEVDDRIDYVDNEESRATAAEGSIATNLSSEVSARIADVDAEESRAIAAEGVLTSDLSTEASARAAAVTAEASRATAAEAGLTSDLSTEVANRITGSASLATDLAAEASRAIAAEFTLSGSLDNEVSRSMAAEGSLEGEILYYANSARDYTDAEASYRVAGDLSLQNQIDFITENIDPVAIDSLTEIVAAFQNADGDINGAISELADAAGANLSTEVARAESAEGVLTADLSAEVSDREAVDAQLSTSIVGVYNDLSNAINNTNQLVYDEESARMADVDAEESRAIEAEESLFSRLDGDMKDVIAARVSAEAVLTSDLSNEVSSRIADVDAEESRAMAAEAVLTSDLSAEVAAREAAISAEVSARFAEDTKLTESLNTEISNRGDAVDNEEYRATTAEASLASDLSSEVVARGTAVDAEASYRVSGDLSLQNQIDFITSNVDAAAIDSLTEIVSAFQSADGDINGAITALSSTATSGLSTEVARAESAEAALTAGLSTEVSNREAAVDDTDTKLTSKVNVEISNRIADVDAEESRAIAAEGSIATAVSAEASRATAAEGSLMSEISQVEEARVSVDNRIDADLSTEVSNREAAMSTEESMRVEADASIAAELSSDIEALADVDGTTIVLNTGTNQIELAEEVAAPASGIRTLMGEIDIETILKVGGVDVMAEISSEISRAEAAEASIAEELSSEVSYLIANTDLGSIDSFAEIVSDLSSEVERAESAEVSIDTAVNNLSTNTEDYVVANRPYMNGFYGAPDGVTTVFDADVISGTHIVFLNGLMQTIGSDYTATNASNGGITVTFNNAPTSTDTLRIYGVPSGTSFNGVNA